MPSAYDETEMLLLVLHFMAREKKMWDLNLRITDLKIKTLFIILHKISKMIIKCLL